MVSFHRYLSLRLKSGIIVFSTQSPSYELSFTLLTWSLPRLAYLSILFILDLVSAAHSAGQPEIKHILK